MADRVDTASASDETDPAPIELSAPSAGKTGPAGVRADGVQSGVSRDGRGRGTAATRADVLRANGSISVRARRQDPYFRRMFDRVDKVLVYPRDLALGLEQGTVVVVFALRKSGRIGEIKVAKSSGFKEFDRAFTRALKKAAPFGEVPAAIRGSANTVSVRAPYTFRNRLIR